MVEQAEHPRHAPRRRVVGPLVVDGVEVGIADLLLEDVQRLGGEVVASAEREREPADGRPLVVEVDAEERAPVAEVAVVAEREGAVRRDDDRVDLEPEVEAVALGGRLAPRQGRAGDQMVRPAPRSEDRVRVVVDDRLLRVERDALGLGLVRRPRRTR
jgi:hypothetical protein